MGKKGKKEKQAPSEADAAAAKQDEQTQRNIEYYELRHKEMTEKLDKLKLKVEWVTKENEMLTKAQTKFNHDKQDIVEFLNIKVGEHEKMISHLEIKCHTLEDEKKLLEGKVKMEIDAAKGLIKQDMDLLQAQCNRYKSELSELTEFSKKKEELEGQLRQYKLLLEKKEQEYKDTVHTLERKVLQDKNRMKREMLQKLNEAVASFRRVADQQMAETTKRAIRENMIISSQLKKMSSKVLELVAENDTLSQKVKKVQINNSLLVDSEKELVKRNFANQKVIKMLVDKLKESDQMLEVAFDLDQVKQGKTEGYTPDGRPILTDEMREEVEALQYDYNILAARLSEIVGTTNECEMILVEAAEAARYGNNPTDVIEYLETNMHIILTRLKSLTSFASDSVRQSMALIPEITEEKNEESSRPATGSEQTDEQATGDLSLASNSENKLSLGSSGQEEPRKSELFSGTEESLAMTVDTPVTLEESHDLLTQEAKSQEIVMPEGDVEEEEMNFDEELEKLQSAHAEEFKQSLEEFKNDPINRRLSYHQRRVEKNFKTMALMDTQQPDRLDGQSKNVSVQTAGLPFGPPTNSKFLLGEVRPWGPRAECLPKTGLGLYQPRPTKKDLGKPMPIDNPMPPGKPLRM
ncbi:hypothetical protein EDD86DRAFT_206108 [Gorgonomyces haynaldii]|nr:hypothetical protein EDD86DRAFT_206108 [Gorgonomyces haynaldii]